MTQAISGNTSATGGPLRPTSPPPLSDLDLDLVFQELIRDLTGLPGDVVRPRFQESDELGTDPPRIPNQNRTWVAVGVLNIVPDPSPARLHNGDGDGSTTLIAHETIEGLASFYGPKAAGYATLVHDGLFIAQNRESLFHRAMALLDVGPPRSIPSLVNSRVRRQVDLPIRLRRRVERVYAIRNVLSAHGTIRPESGRAQPQPFATEPPET